MPYTEYGYWFDPADGRLIPVPFESHDDVAAEMGWGGSDKALKAGKIRLVADPDTPEVNVAVRPQHRDKLAFLRRLAVESLKAGKTVRVEVYVSWDDRHGSLTLYGTEPVGTAVRRLLDFAKGQLQPA
jgi:hypothetical protein